MVFFMKTTAPAIDEPNITAQEPERTSNVSNKNVEPVPYLRSELTLELANLTYFFKKMNQGEAIESKWASVLDGSNVEYCKWKFRVHSGECKRGLMISLTFDREMNIVLDAIVSINGTEVYIYDKVLSVLAYDPTELRHHKFNFENAVRQNCLKIKIQMMIALDVTLPFQLNNKDKLPRLPENNYSMKEDFKSLLNDNIHKDFTLRVLFDEIQVHKIILVARCPYFTIKLRGKSSLKQLELNIIKMEVLKAIVDYMYTDEIPLHLSEMTYQMIVGAKRLGMKDLYAKCLNKVLETVSFDNVAERRLFAEEYGCGDLEYMLNQFISDNPESMFEIMNTEKWAKRHPSVIAGIKKSHRMYKYFLTIYSLIDWKYLLPIAAIFLLYNWMIKPENISLAQIS